MKIKKINGKTLKGYVKWLEEKQMGCCHFHLCDTENYSIHVCVGWHNYGDGLKEDGYDHWVIAWKIGMETFNNAMQCDLDVDFIMPYDKETGDVYDTLEEITLGAKGTMKDYNALAEWINRQAEEAVCFQMDQEGMVESVAA